MRGAFLACPEQTSSVPLLKGGANVSNSPRAVSAKTHSLV